jgi:hypothetical protein
MGIIHEDYGVIGQLLITYPASLKYLRRQDNVLITLTLTCIRLTVVTLEKQ